MNETTKNALDIGHIIQKVGTSEAYTLARNEAMSHEIGESERRRRAIRIAATALKGEQKSDYLTPEGHAMNITAQLTTFGDAVQELEALNQYQARHSEKIPALKKVAEFNHAVKAMIDTNPSLKFGEVLSFILSMNQQVNRAHNGPAFEYQVRSILVGMRHEIAVEQMLGYMPDVEYRETTVDEDLKGADIFVSINGSPMTAIDIKASYETAQRAKMKAAENGYDSSHIVWSHINDDDFGASFRIPHDLAMARSAALYDDLQNAVYSQPASNRRYGS